tara:strand:+ start:10207 stop:10551 length:345 start_codon:yes stop_codon:yes gene_type:complete
MTKKDLVKLIREVVKREIKTAVQSELNEAMNVLEQKKSIPNKISLSEAVNMTKEEEAYPSMGNFTSNMRAQFASMNGATPQTDINNRPVDTSKLNPDLTKALTRDYSELVKRFK